jgi:CRISPR type IV-associated protein Csf2
MPARATYHLILEITPTQPIAHGMGTAGNTQILRRIRVPVCRDGEWSEEEIPCVSGAAFKAALREQAAFDVLTAIGATPETTSKDALRLILKGGKLGAGKQGVNLDELRRISDLMPLLAVFGAMDDGYQRAGKIAVSDVRPWCAELVDAGVAPRTLRPMAVTIDGQEQPQETDIALFPGVTPVPLALATQTVERFKHDMSLSQVGMRFLGGAAVAQIEDSAAAVKAARNAGKKVSKEDRREACESMPYSYEVISPNVPMYSQISVRDATDIEWGCFLAALVHWVASGAHLGGVSREDWGRCSVRIAGAIRQSLAPGVQAVPAGEALAIPETTSSEHAAVLAYQEHVCSQQAEIRRYLGVE